jgi:UDP-glucose 4-epimerase
VLEALRSFEKAVGHELPYEITGRRAGDLPAFWADATSAVADLSWSTTKTVDQMCEDHWRWQKNNPTGYALSRIGTAGWRRQQRLAPTD